MNLDTIAQGAPWMTQDEHKSTQNLVQSIRELLENTNTPEHPIIAMRLEDAATSLILVHRLENKLTSKPGEDKIPAPTRTIGSIGKARERLRRATTELQRVLPAPTNEERPMGLADYMKPIMLRANAIFKEIEEEEAETNHPHAQQPPDEDKATAGQHPSPESTVFPAKAGTQNPLPGATGGLPASAPGVTLIGERIAHHRSCHAGWQRRI